VAVLVPRNARGVEVIKVLTRAGIDHLELLASTSNTRATAGALSNLISFLADPQSASRLSKAYQVWRRDWREDTSLRGAPATTAERAPGKQSPLEEPDFEAEALASSQRSLLATGTTLLRKVGETELFIAPLGYSSFPEREGLGVGADWLLGLAESQPEDVIHELGDFRVHARRWLEAVTLPIDQLVLALAQDVFTEAADLALAHKLALVLRQAADDHPDWRLPELTLELAVIAKNERRFIGFSADDSGFDPQRHRGKVVVTTMHKAKGLEWDRVYLMSVNNYDFPSNMPNDRFISERWFVRSGLNLEAEALAQLAALETTNEYRWYEEGAATARSRLDYVKERLRLLYVGITRAKKDLIVTWNSGRQGDATPSLALSELMGWWESIQNP
jgi:DNA helicase-2/ATP-dependent DNA helicase PcrA